MRQHYDTYVTLQAVSILHEHHVDSALLSIVLRLMIDPKTIVNLAGQSAVLEGRVRGGLTGTCEAGALGRVPVDETVPAIGTTYQSKGLRFSSYNFTFATYVDNIFAAGENPADAIFFWVNSRDISG